MLTSSISRYLLDSNILIYLLQQHESVYSYISQLSEEEFCISAISRTEVLMGSKKENKPIREIISYLDLFECISVSKEVADCAAKLYLESKHPLKFKDLIIASCALINQKTLITADKDFSKLPGLNIVLLKV